MYKNIIASSGLHFGIIILATLSWPFLSKKPIDLPPLISVELIQITDQTNIPYAPKAKKIIEKVKKEQEKLMSEQAPPKKIKKEKPKEVTKLDKKKEIVVENPKTVPKPDKNKDGGFKGMLSSLKGIFGKLDPRNMGGLMKTFLLMSGLALLFKYSDLIEKALAPVLEKAKAFTDMLGPKGSLYLGLAALGALLFPGTFMAVLKAAKLVVIDGLPLAVSGIGTAFRSMKGFLTDTLPGAIKGTYTFGKGLLLKSVALVTGAFKAMKVFLVEKLIPGIYAGFGKVGSATRKLWTKGLVLLKASFASLRLFLVGSLVPAIGSILIPFLPVIAVIAGAVLVITSIYNAFQDFKTALDEGATIGTALAEFGASFLANILALPLDWIKKAIGWIAGILGFEGIKETLDSFSFVDLLKNSFKFLFQKVADFITAMFDFDFSAFFASVGNIASRIAGTLEAVAKGAVAALAAAIPGGDSPQEAFKKKFDEIMSKNSSADEVAKIDVGVDVETMSVDDVNKAVKAFLNEKYTRLA